MTTQFICKCCGHTFKAEDVHNKKHNVSEPVPCPKCNSICTRPDSMFFSSLNNWIYEEIWDEKIIKRRREIAKSKPSECEGIFYNFFLENHWANLNKKDCTIDIELWDKSKIKKVCEEYGILGLEKILFYRDTSFSNSGNEGIVLTTQGIHYRPSKSEFIYLSWQSVVSKVQFEDNALLLENDDEYIRIPLYFFVKGYDELEGNVKRRQSSNIESLLNKLILSKKVEQIDVEKLLEDTDYVVPTGYVEPSESIVSYFNVEQLHVPYEESKLVKELEETLESFNALEKNIYTSLENLDAKYDEWISNVNVQAVQGFRQGYNSGRPEEMIFNAVVAAVGNLYGRYKKKQNRERVERVKSAYEVVQQQYLLDYFYYIAFLISKAHEDLLEKKELVKNLLNRKVYNFDNVIISFLFKKRKEKQVLLSMATAEKCFHLYCKAIVRLQDLINILCEMVNDEGELSALDFKEVVSCEIFNWFVVPQNKKGFRIPTSTAIYKKFQ